MCYRALRWLFIFLMQLKLVHKSFHKKRVQIRFLFLLLLSYVRYFLKRSLKHEFQNFSLDSDSCFHCVYLLLCNWIFIITVCFVNDLNINTLS